MDTRKITTTILVAILVLFLDACGAKPSPTVSAMDIADTAQAVVFTMIAETQTALPTATPLPPTATPVLTATPAALWDCWVSFHFAAWNDFDGNGQWEASETPLARVEFSPPSGFAQIYGYPYLSGADGRLTLTAWSPGGCPERNLTITVVSPASYEPTTPTSVSLPLASFLDPNYEAQFGFRAISR